MEIIENSLSVPERPPDALSASLAGDDAEAVVLDFSHWPPDGTVVVFVGRHGAMNPAGRVAAT